MRDAGVVGGQDHTSVFIGRVAELAVLDGLIGGASYGRAGVVLVAGEAGMGKSRLVGEARRKADGVGALVATGHTPVEGAALPYGTVVGLIRDLARSVGPRETVELLEPVQRLLIGASPGERSPGALARLQLFEAMLHAVEGLAAERPVLLVLEDLHWTDAGTVELLDYLVRNVDGRGVLVAGTFRPDEVERRPPVHRLLAELRRHRLVTTLELGGLGRDEIAALVAYVTGEPQPWTVVEAVHRRSEGNPLFAEELVGVRGTAAVPPSLRDLLAVRIEQLDGPARTVIAAAAVLGVSSDHRLLACVANFDADGFDAALADAVRQRVLVAEGTAGGVRFRHALLREAAYADLLPAERARLHRRAAEALVADRSVATAGPGHAAAELAEHRFEAGDWAAACEASIDAARASIALSSLHSAYTHIRRAIDAHRLAGGTCAHTDVDETDLRRMAAETASLVGELDEAFALAEAALAGLDPSAPIPDAVECWRLVANCAWNVGRHDRAFAAVSAAEARLGDAGGRDAAEVHSTGARLLMLAGRFEDSISRCEEALPLARACGARVTEGHILATLGPCLAQLGDIDRGLDIMREAVVIAEETADPDLVLRAYTNLTGSLCVAGRHADAAAVAIDAMSARGPLALLRLGGAGRNATEALIVLGRWDEAAQLADLMEGKASAACANDSLNAALLALRRGDLDRAEATLERGPPTALRAQAERDLLQAEIALERGRPDDAAAAVDRALAALAGSSYFIEILTAQTFGLRAVADRAGLLGRASRRRSPDPTKYGQLADSVLAEVEECVAAASARVGRPWPEVEALASQCRAEATRVRETDPAAWAAATRRWEAFGAPFLAAYCGFREAEARLRGGSDRRQATDTLHRAWATARSLGAATLVARCEQLAERARITLDDPHNDPAPQRRAAADLGLTAREVEVLDLLARGCTDGQIAQHLFVSKKTASVHVSNILRKVDARDRWHAGELGYAAGLGHQPTNPPDDVRPSGPKPTRTNEAR